MFRPAFWHLAFLAVLGIYPHITFAQVQFRKGDHVCVPRGAKEKPLLDAVKSENRISVERLLQSGADPSTTDDCGIPVITYAVRLVRPDLIKLLISSGADVNAIDGFYRKPPLLWAIDTLYEENDEKVYVVVETLIRSGANVNSKGDSRTPALVLAAEKASEKLVELLISAGADIDSDDGQNLTAYSHAARLGNQNLKRMLIEAGADTRIGVKKYLVKYGEHSFFQAAADGRTDVIEAMLASGTDVNSMNKSKVTALMRASEASTVDALLAAGADVTLKDNLGCTALAWAALYRRTDIVKRLIAAGADVNVRSPDGQMILDVVADSIKDILLKAGAKAN